MTWAFQDAKARLSELVRLALSEGPQVVTVRGAPTLVVLSIEAFTQLKKRKRRKPLADVYRDSPIAGEKLDLNRSRDVGRKVAL